MAQPQEALGYGSAAGPYIQISEPLLPVEPAMPMQVAYATEQDTTTASSSMVYAAAGMLLVAGAVAATRKETAVAEPDLVAAEGAATVAMLFSSGKAGKAAPKRKPVAKKAAAPKRKPAPKPAPKRTVAKGGPARSGGFVGQSKESGVQRFSKNLVSQENWLFQAFNLLKDLPANNAKPGPGKAGR